MASASHIPTPSFPLLPESLRVSNCCPVPVAPALGPRHGAPDWCLRGSAWPCSLAGEVWGRGGRTWPPPSPKTVAGYLAIEAPDLDSCPSRGPELAQGHWAGCFPCCSLINDYFLTKYNMQINYSQVIKQSSTLFSFFGCASHLQDLSPLTQWKCLQWKLRVLTTRPH